MKARWLVPLSVLLVATASVRGQARLGAPCRPLTVGCLVAAPPFADQPLSFEPQPGDIILYDDFNPFFHVVFKLANTGAPTHTAMVIARPDGTRALLELTGPSVILAKVTIMDVETRFDKYPGIIMVRRIRTPLTWQQSQDLTQFAQAQEGKRFALGRVVLQATPFCPRTGLRREMFGKTYLSRNRWFCSELVVAGCSSAHVLDPNGQCGNALYPRDLAFDETFDLSRLYYPPMIWNRSPAR